MLATPLIRKATEDKGKLSEADARAVLEESFKLMYYRDARASNKFQIAVIPTNGEPSRIEGPFQLHGEWEVAHMVA
jgi:20S proteasome subunit beta 7